MSMLKGEDLDWQNFRQQSSCLQKPNANCVSRCLPSQPRPELSSTHSTLVPSVFLQQPLPLLAPLLPFTAGPAPSHPSRPSSGRPSLAPLSEGRPQLRRSSLSQHCLLNSNHHQLEAFLCMCLLGYFLSLPLNSKLPNGPCSPPQLARPSQHSRAETEGSP